MDDDPTKYGYMGLTIPVTQEILEDAVHAAATREYFYEMQRVFYQRKLVPWEFSDRNPMPQFVLFPRLEKINDNIQTARIKLNEWRAIWHLVRDKYERQTLGQRYDRKWGIDWGDY